MPYEEPHYEIRWMECDEMRTQIFKNFTNARRKLASDPEKYVMVRVQKWRDAISKFQLSLI